MGLTLLLPPVALCGGVLILDEHFDIRGCCTDASSARDWGIEGKDPSGMINVNAGAR